MYIKKSKRKSATKRKKKLPKAPSETPKKIKKEEEKKKGDTLETLEYEIDPHQILLHNRNVMLYGEITEKLAYTVNKQLLALSYLNEAPIAIWINSGGGYIGAGWSIIDTMRGLKCPIVTFINGMACSMAGIISVAGHKRVMTSHSMWMGHEAHVGVVDYVSKAIDRETYFKHIEKSIKAHYKKYTKLNATDLKKAMKGELWLTANQCKSKGVIDIIAKC
jgi:ATP-dependent Clp endopeptidase proteolytic subunit ClpP